MKKPTNTKGTKKYYPVYFQDEKGNPLLVVQSRPEERFFIKGVEVNASILLRALAQIDLSLVCPESKDGKHKFVLPPDSFDSPYCKHCYKTN